MSATNAHFLNKIDFIYGILKLILKYNGDAIKFSWYTKVIVMRTEWNIETDQKWIITDMKICNTIITYKYNKMMLDNM